MGPYLRGASFNNKAFAPDGPLRNMVSFDDYVPSTAFPRHIDKKKRAEVVAKFEMDFPDYQMQPLSRARFAWIGTYMGLFLMVVVASLRPQFRKCKRSSSRLLSGNVIFTRR